MIAANCYPRETRFAEIISAMLSDLMKLIRYIRPTSRWTVAHQERATGHREIAFTIVEGRDRMSFDTVLKMLKPGNGVLVENLQAFARRRDSICDRLKAIFAKRAVVVDAKGNIYAPEHEAIIVEAVMTGGYSVKEPKKRVAHNRIDDETRAKALELWKRKDLTNKQVSELAGVAYPTMFKWFQAEYPREQQRGRPRKRK